MVHALKIIIVSGLAHYSAYFVLSRLTTYEKELKKYLFCSVIVIAVAVLSTKVILAYIVLAIMCVRDNKYSDPSTIIAYYFGMAFTMSFFAGFLIAPGVMIGGISHPRVLVLALLLPLVWKVRPPPATKKYNTIDKLVFAFMAWQILVNFRAPSITGILRSDFWLYVDFFVPYVAIRRYMTNYGLVLAAMAFALLSQAAVGIAEAIIHWHIHTDIEMLSGFFDPVNAQYKYRGPFLRVQASFMNPLIFALFANMSFLTSVIYVMRVGIVPPESYSKLIAWGALGISALGTLSSGSRAGIAGSFLIVIISAVLLWATKRRGDPKKLIVMGFVAGILGLVLFGQDFLKENFEYRMRLLDVGTTVALSNPIFGDPHVLEDPRMQVLHLGEGIIDIVNTYLNFALFNGFPAMIFFMASILVAMSKLYDALRYTSDEKLAFGIFSFASLTVLAFNLATTSAFGWTYPWIWISIAIASNIVAAVTAEKREQWLKERGDPF